MKMYCINHVFTEFLNSACENSVTAVFLLMQDGAPAHYAIKVRTWIYKFSFYEVI